MVVCVTTKRPAAIGIGVGKSVDTVLAMVLKAAAALLAVRLQARGVLGTNADTVADLDATLCLLANADCLADDLVSDTAGVWCWSLMTTVSYLHGPELECTCLRRLTHPERRV